MLKLVKLFPAVWLLCSASVWGCAKEYELVPAEPENHRALIQPRDLHIETTPDSGAQFIAAFNQAISGAPNEPQNIWWLTRPTGYSLATVTHTAPTLNRQEQGRYSVVLKKRYEENLRREKAKKTHHFLLRMLAIWQADLELAKEAWRRYENTNDPHALRAAQERFGDLIAKFSDYSYTRYNEFERSPEFQNSAISTMREGTLGWLRSHQIPHREERIHYDGRERSAIIVESLPGSPFAELQQRVRQLDRSRPRALVLIPGTWQEENRHSFQTTEPNYFQISLTFLHSQSLSTDLNTLSQLRDLDIRTSASRGLITPFSGLLGPSNIDISVRPTELARRQEIVRLIDFSLQLATLENLKEQFVNAPTQAERYVAAQTFDRILTQFQKDFISYMQRIQSVAEIFGPNGLVHTQGLATYGVKTIQAEDPSLPDGVFMGPMPANSGVPPEATPHWSITLFPRRSSSNPNQIVWHYGLTVRGGSIFVLPMESTEAQKGIAKMVQTLKLLEHLGQTGAVLANRGQLYQTVQHAALEQLNRFMLEIQNVAGSVRQIQRPLDNYLDHPSQVNQISLEQALHGFHDPGVLGSIYQLPDHPETSVVPRTRPEDSRYLTPETRDRWKELAPKNPQDTERKRMLETVSLEVATAHFQAEGWRVQDISAVKAGFDLLLERGTGENREVRFVEVKGRTTNADSISLTPGEGQFITHNRDRTSIAVVIVDQEGNVGFHVRKIAEQALGPVGTWEGERKVQMNRFLNSNDGLNSEP